MRHFLQISSSSKYIFPARENDYENAVIFVEFFERVDYFSHRLGVEGVQDFRAIQLHYANIAFFVKKDVLITQEPFQTITLHVLNLSFTNMRRRNMIT